MRYARRGFPRDNVLGTATRGPKAREERCGQHFRQAAATRLYDAVLQHGAEIEPIPRAGHRDVKQTLGFLALFVGLILVAARLKLADRYRSILVTRCRDAYRLYPFRGPACEVDDEDKREILPFGGVQCHLAHRVRRIDRRIGIVADGQAIEV
jgi:hypothetical protein